MFLQKQKSFKKGVYFNMDLKIVTAQWKTGKNKETGKEWVGLEVTFQGTEKFTVSRLFFLNDSERQMLGLAKPN